MTDHRDAITGQYVTAEHAKTNPDTTVSESPCAECERLRGVVHTQGVAIDGYREEVERLRADRPIVRTVGDLTARHIGRHVIVAGLHPTTLGTLPWLDPDGVWRVGLNGYGEACSLDERCEVLP